MSPQTRLDAAVLDALRYCPADISDEQRLLVRADLRLQFDYPGQYVAFLDEWSGAGSARTLSRLVIHAGPNYQDVWEATRTHPRAEEIIYEYADDPDGPLEPILSD
jgi:hypothetical protein